MALKQYRERRTSEPGSTDVLEDYPHKVISEELVPRMIKKNRNAVRADRRDFYFYARVRSGRQCSCRSIETGPDGTCPICLSTGVVGGYEKYGCISETGDVTYPNLRLFNVRAAYELQHRPTLLSLDAGATYGFVEFDLSVRTNVKKVDLTQTLASLKDKRRSSAITYVKSPLRPEFVPLTEASLSLNLYAKTITVRTELRRDSPIIESPLYSHVFLRYKLFDDVRIPVDIPKRRESIVLQEWGVIDNWENITLACADKPRLVEVEDIFVHLTSGTKWKVVDVNRFDPAGQLVGHDMNCRLLNNKDPGFNIPI